MAYKRKASKTYARRVRRKYNRATIRRRPMRKYMRGRTGFAKRVKDVILKTAETKFTSRLLSDTNMSQAAGIPTRFILRHNEIDHFNIFNNTNPDAVRHPIPIQGDGDGQRNGDEIYATGVRIAGTIEVDLNHKAASFRMFLVENNDQVFTAGSNISTKNQTMHTVTGSTILDTFQHDRVKPKYLGTVRMPKGDINDATNVSATFKYWLPLKRKFTFRQDDSPALAMGVKNKYTLMILPYSQLGTIDATQIGGIQVSATLYYKDP